MESAPKFKPLMIVVAVVGVAYPFAVYFGLQLFSPLVIALALISFLIVRILSSWREKKQVRELVALSLTLSCVVLLSFVDQLLAIKSYPVALSLSLASLFTYSLLNPPSMIERFARMVEPNLNEQGVRYTRKVTMVWIGFFICNAVVSFGTAVYGDLEVWTFYNGFLSYVCVGGLMGVEFIVRQFVKKHHRGDQA
ncbi:hypothetical protein [Terasakiella pusilla]|uniref:COG4648 family protein n=1 Tax=Terasakiella pusilla TaxID=64973 RepID=UPI00068E3693|nr:hypothetical protein [Terasakiella pusilla]